MDFTLADTVSSALLISCMLSHKTHLLQIGLHGRDDSKSDEELVWRETELKTIPYREYPWTLSGMQASFSCSALHTQLACSLAMAAEPSATLDIKLCFAARLCHKQARWLQSAEML